MQSLLEQEANQGTEENLSPENQNEDNEKEEPVQRRRRLRKKSQEADKSVEESQ